MGGRRNKYRYTRHTKRSNKNQSSSKSPSEASPKAESGSPESMNEVAPETVSASSTTSPSASPKARSETSPRSMSASPATVTASPVAANEVSPKSVTASPKIISASPTSDITPPTSDIAPPTSVSVCTSPTSVSASPTSVSESPEKGSETPSKLSHEGSPKSIGTSNAECKSCPSPHAAPIMVVNEGSPKSLAESKDAVDKDDLIPITDTMQQLVQVFERKIDTLGAGLMAKLDSKLEEIKQDFRNMVEELNHLQVSMDVQFNLANNERVELKERVSVIEDTLNERQDELQALRKELVSTTQANEKLSMQCNQLKQRLIKQESYSRRENLIFFGIDQKNPEDCTKRVKEIMMQHMKMNQETVQSMKFEQCHRLGNRSIICRFATLGDRQLAWASRFNLQKSGISVSEDFPAEMVAQRQTLYPILKEAKKQPNTKAYLTGNKLVINDKSYTVENLNELPPKLNPAAICTKRIGDVTAFFTASSPLSNFFPLDDFVMEGQQFPHVEQYFQWSKAIFAGEVEVARKICGTKSPALCKRLGDSVSVNEQEWLAKAKELMSKACLTKFQNNPRARQCLLDSENTVLVEAGPNRIWGAGIGLNHPNIGKPNEYTGQNLLGGILTKVRNDLKNNGRLDLKTSTNL